MAPTDETTTVARPIIRTYRPSDRAAVAALYHQGLLSGHPDFNDTAADLDYMRDAYFSDERDHFWVAELDGEVVGCVGVAHEESIAQIRRLRASRDQPQRAIALALMDTALQHCRQHGFLKVVLDTHMDSDQAIALLDKCGFQFARNRMVQGKDVLEFYFNLYRKVEPEAQERVEAELAELAQESEAGQTAPRTAQRAGATDADESPAQGTGRLRRVRVLLADDHKALRMGLMDLLRDEPDIEVVGEATDGREAVELARRLEPDLVVMDVSMPKLTGIEATKIIVRELPHTQVIGLSMHEKHEVATSMLEAGAIAYLPKDAPSHLLVTAIRGSESADSRDDGSTR